MINRQLTKKIKIPAEEVHKDIQSSFELEYYLLESETDEFVELMGKKTYGIEIIKRVAEDIIEKETVKNVLCCRQSTETILNRLADNTVTPVSLTFILDDLLGV